MRHVGEPHLLFGNVNILPRESAVGDWEVGMVGFPSKCGGGVRAGGGGGGGRSITSAPLSRASVCESLVLPSVRGCILDQNQGP